MVKNQMKKNDLVRITISDMGINGEGIGKADGFPLFVKDAVIGDEIVARVTKLKKNYGFGRLEEIIIKSPVRCDAPCKFSRQCGGCQLQALKYSEQLRFKHKKVRNNLIHIGGFSSADVEAVMEEPIGSQKPFHYRNKAQFPFGKDRDGNTVTGFFQGRSHNIVANTDCILGVEVNKEILECILSYMKEFEVPPYDEEKGKGLIRHVLIRYGFTTGEIMVCIVVNANKLPEEDILCERLSKIEKMTSVSISVNRENTNVIMGNKIRVLWGKPYITDYIGDLEFRISPLSFYQVNPIQTEKLYTKALEYAGLTGNETVWDLYCGIGTISLFLAKEAKKVYGVEIIPQAIDDARDNAKRNGITNAEFFVGAAEDIFTEFMEKRPDEARPDVVVVDPPRKGCDKKLLETILNMEPEKIVYVSCDSATLARDLKILCEDKYRLEKAVAVDQFSQTVHVETVVLLSQQKPDDHIEIEINLDEIDATSAET